jgi:hypothetical protein
MYGAPNHKGSQKIGARSMLNNFPTKQIMKNPVGKIEVLVMKKNFTNQIFDISPG